MSNYLVTDTDLTSVADAIRTKGGTSAQLAFPSGFVSAVEAIPAGGGGGGDIDDLIDGTITALESNALSIRSRTFYGCSMLETISFPLATKLNSESTFSRCSSLKGPLSTAFPSLVEISGGNTCFGECEALTAVAFPKVTTFSGNYHFRNCTALLAADMASTTLGGNYTFSGCASLSTLVLRSSLVTTLSSVNAFNGTPFASGGTGGTLYVPSALISSYQSATNWTTILGYTNNSIAAIEGSIYETQYADGTPIT